MKDKLSCLVNTVIFSRKLFPIQLKSNGLSFLKCLTPLAGVSLLILGLAPLVTLPAQAESPYSFYRVSGRPEVYLIDDHIWHIDLDRLPKFKLNGSKSDYTYRVSIK